MDTATRSSRPGARFAARAALVGVTCAALVGGIAQTAQAALPAGPSAVGLTGSRPSATALPFPISDQVQASVDVATGNLLVSTTALSLPGVTSTVPIGATYNSFGQQAGTTSTSATNNWALGFAGAGSLSLTGTNVIYTGADGVTWQFAPVSGSTTAFTSPAGFKQDLVKTASGYTLTDRTSRQVVTFDADGKATGVADRNGNNTAITYVSGQPASVVSTAGPTAARTATLAYSPTATTLTITQTANASTSRSVKYVKDAASNLTSFVDAQGKTTTFGYTGRDLTKITSNTGAVTNISYDGSTHKVARIDQLNATAGTPGTSTTRLSYASATQTLVAGPNTDTAAAITAVPRTTYTLNSAQKVVLKAVDAAGRERSATYTGNSDVLSSTTGVSGTGTSGTTTGTYGANNNNSLTRSQSPAGAASQTTYGSTAATAYLPASSTDDAGNQSLKTFNGAGNTLSNADASGATAALTYNADGTVATATAPGNGTNRTVYGYNATKQLSAITPVTGTSLAAKAYTYDAYGRLASQTDGRGNTTTYSYDNNDRILSTSITGGFVVTDTYDNAGRLTSSVSPTGTLSNSYDQLGRLISTSNTAGGGTVTFGYDKASNQISSTDTSGTYSNTFDASGVVTTSTFPRAGGGTGTVTYNTNAEGRRTGTLLDSNADQTSWAANSEYTYDKSGRIATGKTWVGTGGPGGTSNSLTGNMSYCYNTASAAPTCATGQTTDRSKLQWTRDNISGQVTTYSYDTQGRLTTAAQAGGTAPNNTYNYTYDARGNRLTAVVTGASPSSQTLTYNAANQITTTGFAYDGAGNLTQAPDTTLTYNQAQQMVKSTNSGVDTTYRYAGTDQKRVLATSTVGSEDYTFTYGRDDQSGNPTIVNYGIDSASSHVLSDPITGQPVLLATSNNVQGLYVFDGTGNPVGLLVNDPNAYTVTYDPFGVETITYGADGTGVEQTPFVFKGGIKDRASGLVKFGVRWYSALTGAWTQQDTLDAPLDPSDGNRYGYSAGDPINASDPTGFASTYCNLTGGATVLATGVAASATLYTVVTAPANAVPIVGQANSAGGIITAATAGLVAAATGGAYFFGGC